MTIADERTSRRVYRARRGQVAYGYSVGIVCLEYYLPFIPGDVGNASTYDFPVLYREVKGATFDAIIVRQDPDMVPLIVEAAQELVRQGAKAVTSDCGYFGAYQREVAEAVPVPVFLSSLMQVPLILSMLGPGKKVAALVANGGSLSTRVLERIGIHDMSRIVFRGLEDKPEFRRTVLDECGTLDADAVEPRASTRRSERSCSSAATCRPTRPRCRRRPGYPSSTGSASSTTSTSPSRRSRTPASSDPLSRS